MDEIKKIDEEFIKCTRKIEEHLLEMIADTKNAYKNMVAESHGYYHKNRCNEAITLMKRLIDVHISLKEVSEDARS